MSRLTPTGKVIAAFGNPDGSELNGCFALEGVDTRVRGLRKVARDD